jgi:DNA-binding transcriptional ArsR family regulator
MDQVKPSANPTVETRMMKALSHPLRWRILEHLAAGPASPSMIATELDEPLGNVSYHVKILLRYKAIELVETRPVRGALEHVYRAIERPQARLIETARAAGADDARSHVGWTTLDLDQQAYDELSEVLKQTLERAKELHTESATRAAKGSGGDRGEMHETELAIFHYDRGPVLD